MTDAKRQVIIGRLQQVQHLLDEVRHDLLNEPEHSFQIEQARVVAAQAFTLETCFYKGSKSTSHT